MEGTNKVDLLKVKWITKGLTKEEFEELLLNYIAGLDWQEQDELMRKINEVLVNKIF